MRKFQMILLLAIMLFSKVCFAQELECTYTEIKKALLDAISEGKRIPCNCEPEELYGGNIDFGNTDFAEDLQITRLEILGCDGSYTDLIIPKLQKYINLVAWQERLGDSNIDNEERRQLAMQAIWNLLDTMILFDRQIAVYVNYTDQYNTEFQRFLAAGDMQRCDNDCRSRLTARVKTEIPYELLPSEIEKEIQPRFFEELNSVFRGEPPGYFSYTMLDDFLGAGRDKKAYHRQEIIEILKEYSFLEQFDKLEQTDFLELMDNLSLILPHFNS